MPRYYASIHTPTDPETAFEYLSRFESAAEWDPGVSDAEMLSEAPVRLGSRFRLVAGFLGRSIPLVYQIVEFEVPERVVLRAETDTFLSTDTITFSADGAGAVVRYEAVLEAKGWARLADPLLEVAFRRIGDRAAAGLRMQLNAVLTP